MISIPPNLTQFKDGRTVTQAIAWELIREDSFTLRVTNHDHPLTLNDGNSYVPVAAFDYTALEKNKELKEGDTFELSSVLFDNRITFEDLRAGLYQDAIINMSWVDWRFPWLGEILKIQKQIVDINYSEELWQCRLEGLEAKMAADQPGRVTRDCRWKFGDPLTCMFNLTAESGDITTIDDQRRKFRDTGFIGSQSNDFYKFGKITFTSGVNSGITIDVAKYVDSTGEITLRTATPFDFQIGDTFNAFRGCDKKYGTCVNVHSNSINFGGFPYLIGGNELIKPA